MKARIRAYFIILFVTTVLMVPVLATAQDANKNYPNIDYLIGIARMTSDWRTPQMGAPQQRYIKDIATGKTYLVEVGYWTEATILAEF